MLVLSRRKGETIRIGKDVTITVVAIQGGRIQLGIDAHQEIPIRRAEIEPKIRASLICQSGQDDAPEPDVPARRPIRIAS